MSRLPGMKTHFKCVDLMPCKVNRDRKITIPYAIAKKYDIEPGDILILLDKNGKLEMLTKDDYLKTLTPK
jgi:AbrB family looped-hinge helix DNA binding protein